MHKDALETTFFKTLTEAVAIAGAVGQEIELICLVRDADGNLLRHRSRPAVSGIRIHDSAQIIRVRW